MTASCQPWNECPPQGVLLDVGGGNGFVTRRILDEGYPAALVEPGPTGAFNAKTHRCIPDVYCTTFEAMGLRPGSVGAIGCFDVLEHIAEPAALVSRSHAALRPEGDFYLTLPAWGWLWSASDKEAGHFRRYDRAGIADLLSPGFEILQVTALFSVLTLPVLLLRALPFRLGLGGGPLKPETEHGSGNGPMTQWIKRRLDRELARIRAGRKQASVPAYWSSRGGRPFMAKPGNSSPGTPPFSDFPPRASSRRNWIESGLRKVMAELKAAKTELAYWSVDPMDAESNLAAALYGGFLADVRTIYMAASPELPSGPARFQRFSCARPGRGDPDVVRLGRGGGTPFAL